MHSLIRFRTVNFHPQHSLFILLTVGVTIREFPSPRAFTGLVVCAKNNLLNNIFLLISQAICPTAEFMVIVQDQTLCFLWVAFFAFSFSGTGGLLQPRSASQCKKHLSRVLLCSCGSSVQGERRKMMPESLMLRLYNY